MRYDDDYDDLDRGGRNEPTHHPTSAGAVGFVASMVSLGLLVVVLVLYLFLSQEEQQAQNIDRKRLLMWWFLILDILSFLAGLAAIILSSRGLAASNPLYRGWSVAGLILGIIELIITMGFGLCLTCVVFITEIERARPGG